MTLLPTAARTTAAGFRVARVAQDDLDQLSAVAGFSVIGMCLSLIALNFSDTGEWLLAIMNGF